MTQNKQVNIAYIENFPKVPTPFEIRDWKKTAQDYDEVIFSQKHSLSKIVEIEETTSGGYKGEMFVIPSYVGQPVSDYGEALTCLGAVLGGSLAGIDKTEDRNYDWVKMCEAYYSEIKGHGLVLNNIDMNDTGGSFWYDIFPSCLFFHIGALYPGRPSFSEKMKSVADSWLEALPFLDQNWNHTGFRFKTMTGYDTGKWVEPDSAVGIAYLEYMAYLNWGEKKYFHAARKCLDQMQDYPYNPYYEILGSYGPYLAARMNAVHDQDYELNKFLQNVFHFSSSTRPGWGVINDQWGNYDAYGLSGSTTDTDGYAFAMNTFVNAGVVAPMVRYAPQYSRAIGRWLLHVAANANLFYPDCLPPEKQKYYQWSRENNINCITYEGVRNRGETTPFATGDSKYYYNPYGAWAAGFMSALFSKTNVPEILKINLLETDFAPTEAHPTFLYYNPLSTDKRVKIDVGENKVDLYDSVTKSFIQKEVQGTTEFKLPADQAAQLVLVPSEGEITWCDNKLLVNDVVVDYYGQNQTTEPDLKWPETHLAFHKPTTVSSSAGSNKTGENAVDSDWRTSWKSCENPDSEEWICVDLESVSTIESIKLRWGEEYAAHYELQISQNHSDWQTIYSTRTGTGGLDDIILDSSVKGRYVKLSCQNKTGRETPFNLVSFEVYA
ncbi:MAG: discoidin domain-containing protein [Bacillota bacterium]